MTSTSEPAESPEPEPVSPPRGSVLARAFEVANTGAQLFDRHGPSAAAKVLFHRHLAARRRAAARDPRWADIEARRSTGDGGHLLMSADANLGLEQLLDQDRLAERALPDPVWLPVVAAVMRFSMTSAVRAARRAAQLATRGWADEDVWGLDGTLCSRLADQLDYLARTSHGFPGTEQYPTFESWAGELRTAAAGLRGWARRDEDVTSAHLGQLLDPAMGSAIASEDELAAAIAAESAAHLTRLESARDSLRWVADHLEDLWD